MSGETITVYLQLKQVTEVHEEHVTLGMISDLYCNDTSVLNRCCSLVIWKARHQNEHRNRQIQYVGHSLDIIRLLEAQDSRIQVTNIGETDFVIDYQPPGPNRIVWQWCKTIFVCLVCFSGAAFAIMTFNNDVSVGDVFKEIYFFTTGIESDGYTILELTYSIGLTLGILLFFNHVTKWKFSIDPTPLEVEMRLYEENINKTLIQNEGRKESRTDVS